MAMIINSDPVATTRAEPAREQSCEAEEAIRKVLVDGEAAWNRGSVDGWMDQYVKSPETTLFTGKDITKGWETIRERFQKLYQGVGKDMGQLAIPEMWIDFLTPEIALVRGRWNAVFRKAKKMDALFTLIMKKTPEGWRIVHDHPSIA